MLASCMSASPVTRLDGDFLVLVHAVVSLFVPSALIAFPFNHFHTLFPRPTQLHSFQSFAHSFRSHGPSVRKFPPPLCQLLPRSFALPVSVRLSFQSLPHSFALCRGVGVLPYQSLHPYFLASLLRSSASLLSATIPALHSGGSMSLEQRLQEIRDGFERPFWVANISEIFERLSYYGAFSSLAVYLQEKLNFSTEQTGTLTGIFGGMVWFLAIFGGAVADRLGFRRALSSAYLILAAAYFLIGSIAASWLAPIRNAVPLGLFVGVILILPALGISMVKPTVVGTTARASKENVRSIGYSIYYTMVNIGGAAGPYFASWAHRHLGVENVYRVAALSVFAMFFFVLFFFRDPRKPGDAPPPSAATVIKNFCVVLGNYKLVLPAVVTGLALQAFAWTHPSVAIPWWIWIALLAIMLAGISRFMS